MNPKKFFGELKRRNVYKAAVAYAVVAWLVIQITTQVFPFFEIPNWAVRLVVLLLILGFPVALILAWPFELTPEGIKRTEDVAPHESRPCFSGATIGYITQSLQPTAQLREETRQAAETALTLQPNLGEARALKSPSSKRGRF